MVSRSMVWEKYPISRKYGYNTLSVCTATEFIEARSLITARRLLDTTPYSVERTLSSSLATSSPVSDFDNSCMPTRHWRIITLDLERSTKRRMIVRASPNRDVPSKLTATGKPSISAFSLLFSSLRTKGMISDIGFLPARRKACSFKISQKSSILFMGTTTFKNVCRTFTPYTLTASGRVSPDGVSVILFQGLDYSGTSESGPSLRRTPPLERTLPLPPIELPIILIHLNLREEDASELFRADTSAVPNVLTAHTLLPPKADS